MRALTTKSTISIIHNKAYPRCLTSADSSTPASDDRTYYNSGATAGACGFSGWNCACDCSPSPPPSPLPPPDMCECTGDGNQISCSGTGVRSCGGGEECFAPPGTSYPFGQWSDLCAEMCACTGNGNQMSCSGTGVRYCGGGEECFATTKVPYGQWDDMCRQSDRRLQQSSA